MPQVYELQSKLANEAEDKAIALAPDESVAYYARFYMQYGSLDWYGAKETADFARTSKADWSANFIAMPLLGSEMYDQFTDLGHVIPKDISDDSPRDFHI